MFAKLFGSSKSRSVGTTALERPPALTIVLDHVRSVLNDRSQGLGRHWSDDGKAKLATDILSDAQAVLESADPLQATRTRILELMLMCARFDVLVMEPPTRFAGLSGDLKARIPELAERDKDLEEYFYGLNPTPTSFDAMWNAVLVRYWVIHIGMNAFNFMRAPLGDWNSDPNKDWFAPCYTSLCIWQEHLYRQELGLPTVVPGDGGGLSLRAVMHSTWIQRVQEGHRQPRLVWEKSWTEAFEEPSPYHGTAF